MQTNSDYYIGLISGTSVDGIDCALVQFDEDSPNLVETHFSPTEPALREKILRLSKGTNIDLSFFGQVDIAIGRAFAAAAISVLNKASVLAEAVTAIGSHGQTVFHQPKGAFPFSLQLGDPNTIAQLTGITTIADFRRRDMAVGGEGAPLAPLLHRNCFASASIDRVIVNIGGISNITVLEKQQNCFAFDTGPGNVLMDYWVEKNKNQTYDDNGNWARSGKVNAKLLDGLLDEKYFSLPYPKSTGRELFNASWLKKKLDLLTGTIPAEDVQATLLETTARTISRAINETTSPQEIYICGGGAQNQCLMNRLRELFPDCIVDTTSTLGVHPDWVEATAFAWMAKQTYAGKAIDTMALTGASQPTILGGIYRV